MSDVDITLVALPFHLVFAASIFRTHFLSKD